MIVGATLGHTGGAELVLLAEGEELPWTSVVKEIAGYGINHIELGGDVLTLLPEPFNSACREEITEGLLPLKSTLGTNYGVHLPFLIGDDLACTNDRMREASIEIVKDVIQAMEPLSPTNYVLHIAGVIEKMYPYITNIPGKEMAIELFQALASDSVEQICEVVDHKKLCIENLEILPFEYLYPIVEEFDTSICFDIGHLLLHKGVGWEYKSQIEAFLDRYLDRIGQLHIHDVVAATYRERVRILDDHKIIGSGIIDWGWLRDALKDRGWKGPMVMELTRKEIQTSLPFIRQYFPD